MLHRASSQSREKLFPLQELFWNAAKFDKQRHVAPKQQQRTDNDAQISAVCFAVLKKHRSF